MRRRTGPCVVYAASIEQLLKRVRQIMLTSRTVAEHAPFLTVAITGGVLASEALALFDKNKRNPLP